MATVIEINNTGPARVLEVTQSATPAVIEVASVVGERGKSAYQIALDNGFIGTQSEWIDSLRGSCAYRLALNEGFVGTEIEWLESLKAFISVSPEDHGKILSNNGETFFWANLKDVLESNGVFWDLGQF